jgi:glycosyltransferase involved in cell wall biosynthesis
MMQASSAEASPLVAFFIQDLRGGGAERSVVRLANGVAARGYRVDLVVMQGKGPFMAEVDGAVRLVELGSARTAGALPALRRYLNEVKPAALFSAMTHTNIIAVAAARLASHRARLIVVEHNEFESNRRRKRGLVRLAYGLVPLAYRLADVVAGVSAGVCEGIGKAARLPASRLMVLHNPILTPQLPVLANEPVDHPWFAEAVPVILAVGRLTRQKNYPLLIEAMSLVVQQRNAKLLILGEGEERDALATLIAAKGLAERVELAGFRQNPFPFMKRCAVYAMSSDWEGLPTVLVEALALGAPIVSTDCRHGPAEILDHGRYGRLTPPGDAASHAQALIQALDDPGDVAPRLVRAADFSADLAVDQYLAAGLLPPRPTAATSA